MSESSVDILAHDLVRLLSDLTELHGELAMHMRNKLDAIKAADTDRITSISAREMVLAERAMEREGLRRQITRQMLIGLGLAKSLTEPVKLSDLAERLSEPRRSQVLVAAAGLRARLQEIEQMRVTTTLVTQEMLKHVGEVISAMTSGGSGNGAYGRTGECQGPVPARVFEAVG